MEQRLCKKCGEIKSLTEFPINNTLFSGVLRKHTCNTCRNHQSRTRSRLHREHRKPVGGRCPICQEEKALVLDHNHLTDGFRGWLCNDCNNAMGKFNDDPVVLTRAIDYLKRSETTSDLKKNDFSTKEVIDRLEEMGVSVELNFQSFHKHNPALELGVPQREFIARYSRKIFNYLVSEAERLMLPLAKLSEPISKSYPPSKHRALAQRLFGVLMDKKHVSTNCDFVGGINELEKDLVQLEKDGLLKVHDQFYQD